MGASQSSRSVCDDSIVVIEGDLEAGYTDHEIEDIDVEIRSATSNAEPDVETCSPHEDLELGWAKTYNQKHWEQQDNLRRKWRSKSEGYRCQGTTRKGKQCKKEGNPYCVDHWPSIENEVKKHFERIVSLESYGELQNYIRKMIKTERFLAANSC